MAEWEGEKTEMVRIDEIQDPDAASPKSAYLITLKGPKAGKNLKIEKEELTLGRSMDVDVLLDNEGVSRRHARIYREGEHYWLEDLGSTNGVFVNGEKLDRTKLFDGFLDIAGLATGAAPAGAQYVGADAGCIQDGLCPAP